MLTDVIVEEDFERNEDDMWYSRKDLEHGKTHTLAMRTYSMLERPVLFMKRHLIRNIAIHHYTG